MFLFSLFPCNATFKNKNKTTRNTFCDYSSCKMMLVGEPVCSSFKLCENTQANTPSRPGNKAAHQHDEPWEKNFLSNFPEKPLTEK